MTNPAPPIIQLSERVVAEIETVVRRFARFHKYTFGSDLRTTAMQVAVLANRAWRDRARQAEWVNELVWQVDELKLRLQLGKRIYAFASFGQFENIARIAADLGKQVGGWKKQLQHLNRQNASASDVRTQRPEILSTRAASCEANP